MLILDSPVDSHALVRSVLLHVAAEQVTFVFVGLNREVLDVGAEQEFDHSLRVELLAGRCVDFDDWQEAAHVDLELIFIKMFDPILGQQNLEHLFSKSLELLCNWCIFSVS